MRRVRGAALVTAALAASGLLASSALAHDLQVEARGSVSIDRGSSEQELLLHGTLVAATDTLTVTFDVPTQGAWAVDLLLPDREPERSSTKLPSMKIAVRDEADSRAITPSVVGDRVEDEATGVRYRTILTAADVGGASVLAPGQDTTITVTRGGEPVRVALWLHRTDSEVGFATVDPERTPRMISKLIAWQNTPAPGSRVVARPAAESRSITSPEVWLPALIGAAMVGAAVWWLRFGRARARARGVERSDGRRGS